VTPNPQTSISAIEAESVRLRGSLQHHQLMPECDYFGLQHSPPPKASEKGRKHH